jgi:hypothetical protein
LIQIELAALGSDEQMSIEDLRLRVVDLAGQLSLLAWDSKQHEPDERSQPQSTERGPEIEKALAALRPAPIDATAADVNGSAADVNTLTGVTSFSQQEAKQERTSKHVKELLSR